MLAIEIISAKTPAAVTSAPSRRGCPAPGVDIFLLSALAVNFRAALGAGDDDAALAPGYPAQIGRAHV